MTEIECGTIYKVTSPSKRVYIGQTTRPVEMRWNEYKRMDCEGQPRLYKSFLKYGYENHIKEVIVTGIKSKEILNALEILYIATFDSAGENGLNCTLGGEGAFIPEEKLKYGMRTGDEGYGKAVQKAYRETHPDKGKIYYEANKDKIHIRQRAHQKAHREEYNIRNKAWREANPEKVKAITKHYYETHKEERRAEAKAYQKAHKEEKKIYDKAYQKAHKEELKVKNESYRKAHPEKVKAWSKSNYEKHKEEILARNKIYRETHKEELKAKHKAQNAKEREIYTSYGYTQSQWKALPPELRAQMRKEYTPKQTTLF